MRLLVVLGAVALVAGGCGGTKTMTVTTTRTVTHTVTTSPTTTSASSAVCTVSDLKGSFDVQVGSAGAGNIVYTLRLTNTSSSSCSVAGVPQVQLLDASGAKLPTTQVTAPGPSVELAPGASAKADARFSPDVAGTGESQTGPCEPKAATLRVTLAGTVDVPITPPTSVCEHGSLNLRPLAAG